MQENVKVVIDTNILISASISQTTFDLFTEILQNENVEVYYSSELKAEFESVSQRKKFIKYTSPQRSDFIRNIFNFLFKSEINERVIVSRDSKDDYIISLALSCNADFIISGDDDLLSLESYSSIQILTLRNFINYLRQQKIL